MTSDDSQHSRTRLLRELEFLRAQLTDPATPDDEQDEIPLLIDQVEKVIADTDDSAAEISTDVKTEDIAALQAAYRQASKEMDSDAEAVTPLPHPTDETPGEANDAPKVPDITEGDESPAQHALFEVDAEPSYPRSRLDSRTTMSTPTPPPTPLKQPRPVARGDNPFLPKHIRDRLEERRQALADDIAQASTFFPPKGAPHRDSSTQHSPSHSVIDELVAEYLPRIEADLRRRLMEQLNDPRTGSGSSSSHSNSIRDKGNNQDNQHNNFEPD